MNSMSDGNHETAHGRKDLYSIQSIPNKGRGIIASVLIEPFTLVHTAPCLYFPAEHYESYLQHTTLSEYLFHTPGHGGYLLALGHGSLFNHDSKRPNIVYTIDVTKLEIRFSTSYRKIEIGEELCIHYGRDLWFQEDSGSQCRDNNECNSNDAHSPQDGSFPSFLLQMKL